MELSLLSEEGVPVGGGVTFKGREVSIPKIGLQKMRLIVTLI